MNNSQKSYLDTVKDFFNFKKQKNNNNSSSSGIGEKVRSIIEDDFNAIALFILIIILIILIYLLYRNTFSKLSANTKSQVNYYTKLNKINPNIQVCGQLDEVEQHRLCDYYIASSFNTPCIGKPHFDYIDEEMYAKVLYSGARYIQLPICGRSVNFDTDAVVGTAEKGKNLITSLNTLDLHRVLSVIRSNAFKYVKSFDTNPETGKETLALASINNPLIIHIQVNTNNPEVMNKAAEAIKEILGSYLLSPDKYRHYPISLEKLCKLSNKIILFATPGYEGSNLNEIVIPTKYCFRSLTIEDIEDQNKDNLTEDELKDYFTRNISFISQKNSYKNLEIIRSNLDKILENGSSLSSTETETETETGNETGKILEDLFSNKSIEYGSNKSKSFKNSVGELDLFTFYNMIGLTLVEPMKADATITVNPNPYTAFNLGCQLIPMNYHLNNNVMNTYINIFSKSSFVLKPSSLRLALNDEQVDDLIEKYGKMQLNIIKLNIIPDFLYNLNNEYIILKEQSSGTEKILSNLNGGIITFINNNTISSNGNTSRNGNLTSNNVIKVVRSSLSNRNDCVYLLTHDGLALTVNPDFKLDNKVVLKPLGTTIQELKYQTFYPEMALILEKRGYLEQGDNSGVKLMVSFRLYNEILEGGKIVKSGRNEDEENNSNTYYLGLNKNKLEVLPKTESNYDLCTFSYKKANTRKHIQLEQTNFGAIMVNERSGVIFCNKNKGLKEGYKFEIINYKDNLDKEDIPKQFTPVILRINNGRLVSSKNNRIGLSVLGASINDDNMFLIGKEDIKDDNVIIMNYDGFVLGINKDKVLEFMNENSSYLNTSKYFNINYTFDKFN